MAAVENAVSTPTVTAGIAPRKKLGGYDFYREVLGSPKHIVAPMVDQSELAWRILSRRYGADLVYTPMINAKIFSQERATPAHRDKHFDLTNGEEGQPSLDRPLIIQFCANDPNQLLESAKAVQHRCDAVDLNLGCPQDIAKKGRYGSFLQDEWGLIHDMISTLHKELDVPVTAKFRMFPDVKKTVEYARMLESAGAQILTIHGRLREQRGHNTGLADWAQIRAVKEAVKVPVFANGNVLYHSDIAQLLSATGADAVMSAEGQLYNAALFASANWSHHPPGVDERTFSVPSSSNVDDSTLPSTFDSGLQPPHADLALEYLSIARSLRTRTAWSAVKGHLFKLLRPALLLPENHDLRDKLGKTSKDAWAVAEDICTELKRRMDADALAKAHLTPAHLTEYAPIEPCSDDIESSDKVVDPHLSIYAASRKTIPHWLAQPHWRANASAKPKAKKADEPAKSISSKATPSSKEGTGLSQPGTTHGGSGDPTTTTPNRSNLVVSVEEVVTSALDKANETLTNKAGQFTASLAATDMAVDVGDVAVILDATRTDCASGSASASVPLSASLDPFDDLVPQSAAPDARRDGLSESPSISKRTRDARTPELTDADDGAKRPKREEEVKPPGQLPATPA